MPRPPSLFSSHRLIQRPSGSRVSTAVRETLRLRVLGDADADHGLRRPAKSNTLSTMSKLRAAVDRELLGFCDLAGRARHPRART